MAAILPAEQFSVNLDISENSTVKELLYVIVYILTEEYIQIAKENPEIFSK